MEYVELNSMIGGSKVGADGIVSGPNTIYYQRIKLIHGADGVNAGDVATDNPLPVRSMVTPDGVNFYPLFGNSSGIPTNNVNINAGTNLGGGFMNYLQMLAKNLIPGAALKVIRAGNNLATGSSTTLNSWTDQNGSTYTITSGKNFYFARIVASLAADSTTNQNSSQLNIGDATNRPIEICVTSGGPAVLDLDGLYNLPAGQTITAVFGNALAVKRGSITIIGWEE